MQVLGLSIRCIHSEEGCRWNGPLRHLQVSLCPGERDARPPRQALTQPLPQGHLSTCSFNVVPCPNRCPAKLSRRDLPAHLQHDCPKRRLKCEFCGCDFSGEAFEVGGAPGGGGAPGPRSPEDSVRPPAPALPQSHEGVCPQESVYCENKCGARMMRRLLTQHATSECPKRTQPCTYCTKEFVFDTIQVRPFLSPELEGLSSCSGAAGPGAGRWAADCSALSLRP